MVTASTTRGMILVEQLHGSKSDQQVKKLELFRPLQKKLRSALKRFEAVYYHGQKLRWKNNPWLWNIDG